MLTHGFWYSWWESKNIVALVIDCNSNRTKLVFYFLYTYRWLPLVKKDKKQIYLSVISIIHKNENGGLSVINWLKTYWTIYNKSNI